MAAVPPICNFGWKAPDFTLPGIDGRTHSLHDLKGPKGTVVVFICNHCPYVRAVIGRLVHDAGDLAKLGVATIAISSNDASAYPEDSFDNMKRFAAQHGFTFPYLYDETQEVARAYDAVCTPDFFGFNAALELQYRGRLDASRKELVPGARRDLYEAMKQVAETGRGPAEQTASIGCSIKWKAA
jgi:peroxiredoxin